MLLPGLQPWAAPPDGSLSPTLGGVAVLESCAGRNAVVEGDRRLAGEAAGHHPELAIEGAGRCSDLDGLVPLDAVIADDLAPAFVVGLHTARHLLRWLISGDRTGGKHLRLYILIG